MPYWVKQYSSQTKELNHILTVRLQDADSQVDLYLSWKRFDNIFSTPSTTRSTTSYQQQEEKYVVTLLIYNSTVGATYKLYSSKRKDKAEIAFETIIKILTPLVAGSVHLTQELLTVLLLPIPTPLDNLPYTLAQYSTKLSPVNKQWKDLVNLIINGIPLAYCICEVTNMSLLKEICELAEVNIASVVHPVTNTTLVHLATQLNDESLRETIFYLRRAVKNEEEFLMYINYTGIITSPLVQGLDKIIKKLPTKDDTLEELGAVTALTLAVRKSCVRSVHYLLVGGCNPNYQDPTKGMTALHIAAVMCNVSITKLLLSFDADLTLTDAEGKTPIDVVSEREGDKAEECLVIMKRVQSMRNALSNEAFDDMLPVDIKSKDDDVTLLSIDGGGTRGVICSFILYYIEKRMLSISKDDTVKIRHYFNWYAATSVGSVIALPMTHNNCNTRSVMESIVINRHHLLAGSRPYDGPTQDHYARLVIGLNDFKSISIPKVLVTTTRADRNPPRLVLITNYRDNPGDDREWKAWQAARASTAAPFFFPSYEQKYVDGGILATNPTQHALHDIHVYEGNRKVSFILSLGTGICPPATNESIDLVKPRLTHLITDLQRDVQFIKSLKVMLTANIVNCEDTVLHSKCWCESQGGVYHRLSPPLTQRLELDVKSDDAFVLLFYETYLYLLNIDDQISSIAKFLIKKGPKFNTKRQYKSTWV